MAAVASLNVNAIFKKAAPAKKAPAKKAPAKKAPAPKRAAAGGKRSGNIGPNRTLWNGWESTPEPPAYLDGTLPGDAGFDPWGLSSPTEYLQFDLDSLDGSAAVNPSGNVIGKLKKVDNAPTERTIVVRLRSGEENLRAPPSSARATRDVLSDRPVPTRISIRIVPSLWEPFAANRARGHRVLVHVTRGRSTDRLARCSDISRDDRVVLFRETAAFVAVPGFRAPLHRRQPSRGARARAPIADIPTLVPDSLSALQRGVRHRPLPRV
jgi:hypothetical protein